MKDIFSNGTRVWTFRPKLFHEYPESIKAIYKGPSLENGLQDFTICLRYNIKIFNKDAEGIEIFKMQHNVSQEEIKLTVTEKWTNRFEFQDDKGNKDDIWFHNEIPLQ